MSYIRWSIKRPGLIERDEPIMKMSRKQQRRLSQKELKQRDILDAAERIFGQKGYSGAAIHEIADLAEFSLSALYRLYDSKEVLFHAVLNRRGKEIAHGLYAILTQALPPSQKLHQLVDYSIDYYHRYPDFGRAYLLMVTTAIPFFEPREAEEYRPPDAELLTAQVIREGQSSGEIVSGEPMVLSQLLTNMVVTYLTTDPRIMGEQATVSGGLSREQFHDMVDRIFCKSHAVRR